ncbi:MAG: aspartate aminotransferase family protein [Anaerolineales bacterium]|nr:aspartate aminotransferase family protein [Anaerolineales bacterium]
MDETQRQAYIEADRKYICRTTPFPKDMVVEESEGCVIYTVDGEEYLDLLAGIAVCNVGHRNPEVVQAVKDQVDKAMHTMVYGKYVIPVQVDAARLLAEVTPPELQTTFFTNSGCEGIEGALKTARKYTGRSRLISCRRAFHGRTFGALSVTWREKYRKPFEPLLPDVEFIPFDDIDAAREAIDERTAAIILEPIQGEGGVRIPGDDYLPAVREFCDRTGALMIFDEVQSGFGRTGKWFSCEHWDVTPDIMVLAKALGGGMPIGAFIGKPHVMDTLCEPMLSHLTTFGGHPVCCAAAKANIEYMKRENLPARSAERGEQFMKGLREQQERYPGVIAEVRGKGLMIGVELKSEEVMKVFVDEVHRQHLIIGDSINNDVTARLEPPLTITREQVQTALDRLDIAFGVAAEHFAN